ncbi:MAG: 4-hydroxythreonine-4-phosphate dehydrogenase [Campylobacterota bacterium]
MKKIAISIGDLNGIGLEIALKAHQEIKAICDPLYMVDEKIVHEAAALLQLEVPQDFVCQKIGGSVKIKPSKITEKSGKYSFKSFQKAIKLAHEKKVDAITTLPIHKQAWAKAGVEFKGHTDVLRYYFKEEAIMMLGCQKMFVALFTEHIPLKGVAKKIKVGTLSNFLQNFHASTGAHKVAVLGLNPHAGDGGVLGDEEKKISSAIKKTNKKIGSDIYDGPFIPDVAFTQRMREKYTYFVAMYHDQGLAPLKALYFDESINVSLNLPIIRTSVDHGTAFDIAYKNKANTMSYINAIKEAVSLAK